MHAPIAPKNSIHEINSLGDNHFNNFLWLLRLQACFLMDWPLKYDHPDRPAYWQMIIWMDWPFANDYQDWTTYCKWSSWSTSILQMILLFLLCYSSPPQKNIFFLSKYFPPFPLLIFSPAKKYFPYLNIFLISLSQFCSPLKKYFPSSNVISILFLLSKHRKNCECCPGHYLSTSVY